MLTAAAGLIVAMVFLLVAEHRKDIRRERAARAEQLARCGGQLT